MVPKVAHGTQRLKNLDYEPMIGQGDGGKIPIFLKRSIC
jgi:hypothetical protein